MTEPQTPGFSKRYAALLGALTLLAHAGINAIHEREIRQQVRNEVRGVASPGFAAVRVEIERMKAEREKNFVRSRDLAPIAQEIKDVRRETYVQGQRLARIEGYLKAQVEIQRRRLRAALPGQHLEARVWDLTKPARDF